MVTLIDNIESPLVPAQSNSYYAEISKPTLLQKEAFCCREMIIELKGTDT